MRLHCKGLRRHPSIAAVPFRMAELPPLQDITVLDRDKAVPVHLVRYTGKSSYGTADMPPCREVPGQNGSGYEFDAPDGRVVSCAGCQRTCLPEYAAVRLGDGALCSVRLPAGRFLEGHRVLVLVRRDRRAAVEQDAGIQTFPESAAKAAGFADLFAAALDKAVRTAGANTNPGLADAG